MSSYIPYSKRNNIADTDLAGLLDYIEREIGDVVSLEPLDIHQHYAIYFEVKRYGFRIEVWHTPYLGIMTVQGAGMRVINRATIEKSIFFRTYKTLLPVIRDLYSK